MVTAHHTVAFLVVTTSALAGIWGVFAFRTGRTDGRLAGHLLALAQTLLVAQVALGLLLLSEDREAPDRLHYAYGSLALGAALAPWLYAPAAGRRRLLWFSAATLVAAALAVRAFMTAP